MEKTVYFRLTEVNFRFNDTQSSKVKGWEKVFHANGNQKKVEVTVLISGKVIFKPKRVTKDKRGYYTMIKASINQRYIIIINIYMSNIRAPKYIKQTLTDLRKN